jgi:hypothetical protein
VGDRPRADDAHDLLEEQAAIVAHIVRAAGRAQ